MFRRIHLVRCTVLENHTRVDHRVACQQPLQCGFLKTLFNGWDVVWRNLIPSKLAHEFDAFTCAISFLLRDGFHVSDDLAVLATTTRLLLVRVVVGNLRRDGFAIVDLRSTRLQRHVELTPHAFAVDIQVQLSHARDDRLLRLLVRAHSERGILALEPLESLGKPGLIISGCGHGQRHDGIGDVHGAARDACSAICERDTRLTVNTCQSDDVTCGRDRNVSNFVGVHPNKPLHSEPLLVQHVGNGVSLGQFTLIYPHVRHLSCGRVVLNFERVSNEGLHGIGLQLNNLALIVCVESKVFLVLWRWQVPDECIKHVLHTFVFVR
mmetsp:Transcript_54462/g.145292  ORF Transcript_54462/g.145292 Transcript_54462/m.145292 type:complete len:323 (+) Transcript_54462:482-1450(+)